MKTCTECKLAKEDKEFYIDSRSGRLRPKCKACYKKYRDNIKEKSSLYFKERYQKNKDKILKQNKAYRAKNKDKINKQVSEYKKTEKGKQIHRKSLNKYKLNNPEKRKAHTAVSNAIARSKIVKPAKCSCCKQNKRLEAHHEDYDKPLDVIWLCKDCHTEKHKI